MQYEKQNFRDGTILSASQLNHIENGIVAAEEKLDAVEERIILAEELLAEMKNASVAWITEVTLLAEAWVGSDSLYSQVVTIDGITEYSKVDLLPSVEQLAIFFNKNVSFVTENEDGTVTVFAIGDKPTQDYTMQAQITEVEA